ncbi:MAG: LysM peptidoglycan-binding domain-containing protein [Acidobacteriia bacterium]|nr:LysM peptidoglycan-binding domain-containing protein [Terriglobia bacterium]
MVSFKRTVTTTEFLLLVCLAWAFASCDSAGARKKPIASPPVISVPSPLLSRLPVPGSYPLSVDLTLAPFDAVRQIIEQAEEDFREGEQDYHQGHLDRAKKSFDRAVDTMLQSSLTLHSDERLEKEFDSLIDRIHAYEVIALKEGDGFTTQKYEPAPSDEILDIETFPSRIDDKLKATAEKELAEVSHDLPITVNERVLNFLDYFTRGRGRGTMENGLRRVGAFRPMIDRILRETGVPKDLIYLAQVESGYQPLALSNKKAKGIWQFVPFRGAEYGLVQNWWVDERQDPEKSTRAAAQHLKDLYGEYEDWYLAMAAYNCGPGNVQRAIERSGYADFWQMVAHHVLPLQTENYVPAILAVTIIAKNPEKYGFTVEPLPPLMTERVTVSIPTDLRLIAETIDTSVENLQSLNPQLLRMTTPPNEPDFQLNLPLGTKEKYIQEIAAIPEDKRVLWRRHRVTTGETLSTVASRYRTTVSAIAQINELTPGSKLEEGTKIIIPAASSNVKTTVVKHRVDRGETLAIIAARYDVTQSELRKWNRLRVNAKIRPGQRLTVRVSAEDRPSGVAGKPGGHGKAPSQSASRKTVSSNQAGTVVHSVRPGETLFSIAQNYNTTVETLKQINGIRNVRQLRVGDKIRISAAQ